MQCMFRVDAVYIPSALSFRHRRRHLGSTHVLQTMDERLGFCLLGAVAEAVW